MENPYIKQFPDLMKGKKIMYVHGFASSARSGTVTRLREMLPSANVIAFDLPVDPHEAISLLHQKQAQEQPDLIIGTSMGGMYAEQLSGTDRILVNPAFHIADTMGAHGMIGKQTFLNPREDGVQEFIVTKAMVKEYRAVQEQCFSLSPAPPQKEGDEKGEVWGLFGDEDPLVHTYPVFMEHYDKGIWFHGEHRMNDRVFSEAVIPVIRWIDDRQEGRERPIIYMAIDTLRDNRGQQRSSAMKALKLLLECYNIYIVAPCPSYDAGYIKDVQEWTKAHVSVPAFGHLVFTNQRHLLLGDYLIDATPCKDFMGTQLHFGDDTFKTWEEVIAFFSRLGGQ